MHWFLGTLVVRWHNYYNCFNTLAANYISMFFFFIDLSFSTSFSFFCFMLCPWWHSTIKGFDFELRANPARSWALLPSAECKGGLGPLSILSDMSIILLDQIAICIYCLYSETSWHFLVNCCGITDYWGTSTFEKSCCRQIVFPFLQNKQYSD